MCLMHKTHLLALSAVLKVLKFGGYIAPGILLKFVVVYGVPFIVDENQSGVQGEGAACFCYNGVCFKV